MTDTKFYVELPADEYGNVLMPPRSVVEARSEFRNGHEMLIPVAPAHHATGWPTGWRRAQFGGWAETEGPARVLSDDEWKELIDNLPQEGRDRVACGMVKLKNGAVVPEIMVTTTMITLKSIATTDPTPLYELVMLCRNPEHKLFGRCDQILVALDLITETAGENGERSYVVHDMTRDIVLSMATGDGVELTFGSPLAE